MSKGGRDCWSEERVIVILERERDSGGEDRSWLELVYLSCYSAARSKLWGRERLIIIKGSYITSILELRYREHPPQG